MRKAVGLALGLTGVSVLAVGLWFALDLGSTKSPGVILAPGDPSVVSAGADIYADNCAACHGAKLEGQPNWRQRNADGRLPAPPHDETGHTWHHNDAVLFTLTKFGPQAVAGSDYQSDMPAYEGVLSDNEILAVLSYIKSRWPVQIQARHDRINAAAQQGG